MVTRKSRREIEKMRTAGRIVAEVLALVESELRPGISTAHLDRLAERHIRSAGAVPSFKGYGHRSNPFPASLCISIDDEVVHGIPGERQIRDGQIVSVDAGAIYDGWHGDGARTFVVGQPPAEIVELIDTTRLAMMAGIAAAIPNANLGDISGAIEDVAAPHGYGIVRQFVGHGIGTEMHQEPQVPNYRTGVKGMKLAPGICLAIEPMLTLGSGDVAVKPDGWTVVTRDGSLAAHFEHTIAITDNGPEILTTVLAAGNLHPEIGIRSLRSEAKLREPSARGWRARICRVRPCLIRYAFVCRSPAGTDTQREKGKLERLWPSEMRSRWRERSSNRSRTRCSPSSWRTATGSWPTSAASCG
jgi:methionyl aminopeptidase